eukprot:jgi/Psemu1/324884/estExt_fgenesh1_pg.C_1840002
MEETTRTNKARDFSLSKASRVGGPVTCVAFSPSKSWTENHDKARSSFFFVAQGPYLTRYNDDMRSVDSVGDDNQENRDQQLLVFPEDERRPRGGGTVHGISFLERDESDNVTWDAVVYGGKRLSLCHLLRKNLGRSNVIQSFQEHSNAEMKQSENDAKNSLPSDSPFLELDDWIWNVKIFPKESRRSTDGGNKSDILYQEAEKKNELIDPAVVKADTIDCLPVSHHLLQGHSGVVHSVRWFEEGGKVSLASTSDDRSVRKWIWDDTRKQWVESWVGWGHSARVWNVSRVNSAMLVSVAEDGTARVWSAETGETLACIHHSTTLWTIDTRNTTDGGKFIIGGTDGISGIYSVGNHTSTGNNLRINSIAVPDDRAPESSEASTAVVGSTSPNTNQSGDKNVAQTKKKKKAKKKIQSQVIVGMKCWQHESTGSSPKVIVATRQGSLLSFDINEQDWNTCDPWWNSSIGERFGIQANDGNCMAIRDNVFAVAIGTARGDIMLASIQQGKEKNHNVLNARKLRAVQGLTFLDSFCLVSFHVRTVALWNTNFDCLPALAEVHPNHILQIETKGIPQCCAYDQNNQRIVIGDSRGNLSYFLVNNQEDTGSDVENHINPLSTLARVHQKQHVTSIKWLNQTTILSAGNDGCLHVSYLHRNVLQRGWSFSASSLTGITSIIRTQTSKIGAESYAGPIIVAGYHGNTYRVMDTDSGYEYIRCDTGGRQRILDCRFDTNKSNLMVTPLAYQLIVCQAQKDGSNRIFVQHSLPKIVTGCKDVTRGVKLHGETIFESSFFTLTNQELVFLVTASEDCTTRISSWKDGRIVDSVLLTPQESCCRCVTVSKIDNDAALLVVGGGKLALQFFLIKEGTNSAGTNSARDLEITFLGNGLTCKKRATIDHRINSISAIPLCEDNDRFHLVIAGDSEGCSHAFLISEDCNQSYRDLRGCLVPTTSERPILSLEMLAVCGRILILMGTTGGEVGLFDLTTHLSDLRGRWDKFEDLWNHIGSYRGHQMGTNTLTAEVLSSETVENKIRAIVSIVSGGDDQALCISRVSLEGRDGGNHSLQLLQEPHVKVIPEASFSAIKGVSHVGVRDQRYLLCVGYSQHLSIWKFDADDDMLLECTSRLPVDLGDVNCLSVYKSFDESTCLVAVCGMGVEVFRDTIS